MIIKVENAEYPHDFMEAPAPTIPSHVYPILDVHHGLWNRDKSVTYKSKEYQTYTPTHGGYSSVILPNENGYNFLWITQNLNKSSGASLEIIRSHSQGDDTRVTWIVDNSNNKFTYVGLVKTTDYFDGKKSIIIERYDSQGTQIIYSTDPAKTTRRSSI
jgi:hypothetical protein